MTPNLSANAKTPCSRAETLEQRLACLADAGPAAIDERLNAIESEWSAGRVTKAVIGVTMVVGLGLTALLNPWWLLLPAAGSVFLLQYLFGRTSWLGKTFQEMGFRSGAEIEQEKLALRALRGDFRHLPTVHDIETHEDISRLEGEGGIVVEPEAHKVDPKAAVKEVIQATM